MMNQLLSPALMRPAFWVSFLIISYLLLSPQIADVPLPYNWITGLSHLVVHAGLAFLAYYAFARGELWGLILLGLYAIGTESLQHVIPGRFFDLADMGLNLAGIVVGNAAAHAAGLLFDLDRT